MELRSLRLAAVIGVAVACSGSPGSAPGIRIPMPLDATQLASAEASGVRVYPGTDRVPANGLLFQIVFDQAMALGPHQVHVKDQFGTEVPGAVRAVQWDELIEVLTVEPQGLEVGQRYVLVIEGLETRSAGVLPTRLQSFVVMPPDLEPPSGRGLRVLGAPKAGSTAEITVGFPEAVRRSSLGALTALAAGRQVQGAWRLTPGEEEAVFTPAVPWGDGPVHVSIAAGVEDLGGNEMVDRPTGMIVPMVPVGTG